MTAAAWPRLRQRLGVFFGQPQAEARRVFHGRGHCFPGLEHLCIDWYPPVVLITAYRPLIDVDSIQGLLIESDVSRQIETILLQSRQREGARCTRLFGPENPRLEVVENELRFEVRPGMNQNAGLFLDMRLLRAWLKEHCQDRTVLNLFAYTCSLSVAALAGGATAVTNVDVSKTSIAWGDRNHRLNNQDATRVRAIPHNLFTSWGRIRQYGPYDLVIMDPPTRQRRGFDARRDYGSVLKRLPRLCRPGARLVAALNSPFLGADFVLDQCARHLSGYRLLQMLPVAPEFEEVNPDKGLKLFLIQLPD